MSIGISNTLRNLILQEMIDKDLESVTKFGITLSTEKKETSLPTGMTTKDGKMIYVQA